MPIGPTQRINSIPAVRKDKTGQEKAGKPKGQKKDDGDRKGKIDIRVYGGAKYMAFFSGKKPSCEREKALLALELSEIKDISDMLFQRIDRKIRVLEALEASLDRKTAALERLLRRSESSRGALPAAARQREVLGLAERGMGAEEIADVLDMSAGEAELILELNARPA